MLLTPKIIIIILPTLTNYFYSIFPTPLSNNTLIGILLVYILAIKEGEILGQNINNILKNYILENNIFAILLLLLILY